MIRQLIRTGRRKSFIFFTFSHIHLLAAVYRGDFSSVSRCFDPQLTCPCLVRKGAFSDFSTTAHFHFRGEEAFPGFPWRQGQATLRHNRPRYPSPPPTSPVATQGPWRGPGDATSAAHPLGGYSAGQRSFTPTHKPSSRGRGVAGVNVFDVFPPRLVSAPVGARLQGFAHEWAAVTSDQWVLSTVTEGYRLEFTTPPLWGTPCDPLLYHRTLSSVPCWRRKFTSCF